MKCFLLLLFVFSNGFAFARNPVDFDQYFLNQTMRIDYYHTGDAKTEEIIMDQISREGLWAGNPASCIQPVELGLYNVKIIDIATNRIIFTKGYNSIFAEYQTIDNAIQGIKKTYHESVLIPCPKRPFIFIIEKRDRNNLPATIFMHKLDPADYHIHNENTGSSNDVVISQVMNGNPHKKVDLVFLGEGYKISEFEKFKKDLKFYSDLLLSVEPFKSRKMLFNIHGIFRASEESGTDEPREGVYKNTVISSTFNYFDLDRYCLADNNRVIRDMASVVPYDAILIMVNTNRYGGGGIYNWQTIFTSGSDWCEHVFLHEFGHAFAGLADEYFSSPVAYVDFYTAGTEPLEPNITALPDTGNVKWKEYLSPGIQIPTDWGKAVYDSLTDMRSKITSQMSETISGMHRDGKSTTEIEKTRKEYLQQIYKISRQEEDFFTNHPLKDKVGVFEGANYMSKGMYRPTLMSIMLKFTKGDYSFNIVNEHAIVATIDYYTK